MRLFKKKRPEINSYELYVLNALWKMGNVASINDLKENVIEEYDFTEEVVKKSIDGLIVKGYVEADTENDKIIISKDLKELWIDKTQYVF
ncbi:MAG: BlaI/MecI/CopY family transcriptional regulator [Lachnospiraceae bacterium]|nr:BlaI/MecI/CopY family transcriptional regulator [Lachnospiraceae bacterium]